MNITFICGNGFDIGLNLPTGYENFYKLYGNNITEQDSEVIIKFKEAIKNRNDPVFKKVIDWSDFEIAFGKYSECFTDKEAYRESFINFVEAFSLYLEYVESCIDYNNVRYIESIMNKATSFHRNVRNEDVSLISNVMSHYNHERRYNFITFNYTNTVDKCAKILNSYLRSHEKIRVVDDIVHVHGYIDEYMIVGVNDPSQIINSDFAQDEDIVKLLVKPKQNQLGRTEYEKNAKKVIDKSNMICVYGMSIGSTDKLWWDYLTKWLLKKEDNLLVILKHDSKCKRRLSHIINGIVEKTRNELFENSSLSDEEKDKISKRIIIDVNKDVFQMDNIFLTDKFEELKYENYGIAYDENSLETRIANLETTTETMPRTFIQENMPINFKKGDFRIRPTGEKIMKK